ncbi:putative eukaryotic translation initiation factor 3 subunit 2 [Trypanosoma cruzi]|uniref:Eukaryotic translation initiation factor 3 subunit I n=2 Tax=Trypanosoma cruzi TaxID=5693 RepID=Q4DNQ4_TRYCC|nr:eukaryotic translation initiation factor 3 subunit, putative [Trypanosoma cruzi]EAN94173.1 eukaryotic translation initiation factor 3 subunit, putative [Trypanosoma cruzi]KAF5220618.1 eukaryotic translation initiation factor 3 subunit i [Trypanosoma cruzi]KAF8281882.1 eukaryotic translation initiation factor 3 subunit i [Trypanosoma cruzi]PWV17632.1 putative eukaryotic translation initiation factor 3 subunit 2 [Trypanosoma cruzi]RNC58663.1 translation initiation factor 34 [Trypanosoma cruzi|eukprot:XP_816024.1 eukaryotic translation initiation factor 3 subunit [Trypanosoma cruzi strain CL Brener]
MNIQGLALHGHMKPVTMIKFNREGDLLFSTAKEPNISVWYTKTGERLGVFNGHSAIAACDVNNYSTLLVTGGMDFKAKLWCVESGDELANIMLKSPARAVGFAHDDSKVMVSTSRKMGEKSAIQLYNLPFAVPKEDYIVHPVKTAFNPCAEFVSESDDITFAVWGPTNDTIYYSMSDGSVAILDVETMRTIRTQQPHEETVNRIGFDCNYYTLITASKDKTARLLDSRDMSVIQTYRSDVPVNDASISPCGDHVILGGGMEAQDVTTQGGQTSFEVKFYHKVHEKQLGQVRCHFGTINAVSFFPDGRGFASGAFDGLVKLHRFDENYEAAPGAKPVWSPDSS